MNNINKGNKSFKMKHTNNKGFDNKATSYIDAHEITTSSCTFEN